MTLDLGDRNLAHLVNVLSDGSVVRSYQLHTAPKRGQDVSKNRLLAYYVKIGNRHDWHFELLECAHELCYTTFPPGLGEHHVTHVRVLFVRPQRISDSLIEPAITVCFTDDYPLIEDAIEDIRVPQNRIGPDLFDIFVGEFSSDVLGAFPPKPNNLHPNTGAFQNSPYDVDTVRRDDQLPAWFVLFNQEAR